MHIILLVVTFLLCLFGTFFFAGAETGFVSWNPLKVSHRAGKGDPVARLALYLMDHQDRVISATLIASNISIVGATLTFLKIAEITAESFSIDLSKIPSLESWVLTPVIVLFCEMLPKSLFRIYSFRLTMKAIPFLFVTYILTFPFTWAIALITGFFNRIRNGDTFDSFNAKVREEMVLIAGEGSRRGTLFESADKYIHRIFNLKDMTVADLMIGVNEINSRYQTFSTNCPAGELKNRSLQDDEVIVFDEITGIPSGTVDLADVVAGSDSVPLRRYIRPLLKIPGSTDVLVVLQGGITTVSNYISIIDNEGAIVGVIEKIALFRVIFGGLETNLKDI
ncbi:MAG TPA: CNNM domain-containing protein [Chitinispirillaceae bacterium]|nr:CNNM domain-containing protein [Chitinispirillaceae bacterium]